MNKFIYSLVAVLFLPTVVFAQTITFTGPATTIADADEFFTDSWGIPKTFDTTCDAGFDNWNFEPESSTGGIWSGVHPEVSNVAIGFIPIPTIGSQLAFREDCGRLGLNYPVDADKYTQLSYRINLSSPSSYSVLWTKDNSFATNGFADFDGYFLQAAGVVTAPNTWSIKSHDLPARSPADFPWSGEVTGLSLFPSFLQTAGGTVRMDWMRLVDPSTSPSVTFNWTTTGSSADAARDNVAIYVDDNNSGYDGQLLQRGLSLAGSTNIDTGMLPPGEYYFYANFETDNTVTPRVEANSAYVGPITVNGKPVFEFTAPSRTSGREYARDVRGDEWDMNESTDLDNLLLPDGTPTGANFRGFHGESFSDGYFRAETDFDATSGTVDTQVHFTTATANPINPREFRYFCYSMQVDPLELVRNNDPVELNRAGWVARLVWQQEGIASSLGSTFAHELIEKSQTFPDFANGFVEYCVDLWDPANKESGPAWLDTPSVNTLRFDPLEASDPTGFIIDHAGLYAENTTDSGNTYTVRWDVTDPDNDLMSVSLYYDTNDQDFNGTLITTLNAQSSGSGSFTWNADGLAEGEYYLYAVVNDGLNTQRAYSRVVVNVGDIGLAPLAAAAPCDFDGDSKTDTGIVRGALDFSPATWFTQNSSDSLVNVFSWGSRGLDAFVAPDLNGDRASDETFFRGKIDQFATWFTDLSASGGQSIQGWGITSDVPLVADFDGDGRDDVSVFRPQDGSWWSIRSTAGAVGMFWGAFGDIPAVADYDGDGIDDIAVWRPSDGFWWITQSSKDFSTAPADIEFRQWGLPGDHPMPGDYTGDGVADLVIWRSVDGNWFNCTSESGHNCAEFEITQFGLPGDIPVKADFDGDGTLDLAVWRPSNGYWFYKQSSDGAIAATQWGLPGDLPLCTGMRDSMHELGHTYIP